MAGPPPAEDPERGDASVLTVTGIGMLAVMAMLGLAGRAVVERRAVEDSIAEMRAYWAAMGHMTYALSRTRFDGTNKKPAQEIAKTAAREIADGGTGPGKGPGKELSTTWRYPDVSSTYAIVVNPADPKDDGGAAGVTGKVLLGFDFDTVDASAPAALRTIPGLRGLEFRYCVVPSLATACGNAPPPGNSYTLQRVTSVHRVPVTPKP